jgi:Holliday junction resolvase
MVKSYARGRRFEYHVVDKLAKHGISSRRITLSGRQPAPGQPVTDIPNADIIVEEKFRGKAKTTKAKKYVSFPEKEILELENKDLNFLVFNFSRTNPFVVIRFDDFIELVKLWKEKGAKI